MGNDKVDQDIGQRLRGARQASGMSLRELGALIQVTGQQIQKVEAGRDRISATVLYRIARALDLSIADLLPAITSEDDHPQADDFSVLRVLRRLPPHVHAEVGPLIEAIGIYLEREAQLNSGA